MGRDFPRWLKKRKVESSPFTLRLAEHLALAAVNMTSPVWGTLQLYKTRVCLAPSSTISTSCRWPTNVFSKIVRVKETWWGHNYGLSLLAYRHPDLSKRMKPQINEYLLRSSWHTVDGLRSSPFSFHWPWTSSSLSSTSNRAVSPSNTSAPYIGRTTFMWRADVLKRGQKNQRHKHINIYKHAHTMYTQKQVNIRQSQTHIQKPVPRGPGNKMLWWFDPVWNCVITKVTKCFERQ